VQEALSSGYTPISVIGVVGLYLFALSISKRRTEFGRSFSIHALLILILLALVVSTGAGWHVAQQTRSERDIGVSVLQNFQREPDTAISTYLTPNASAVRQWAPYLQGNRLNVFARENVTSQVSTAASEIKAINGSYSVQERSPI